MPATINRRLVRETTARIHSQGESRAVLVELTPNGQGRPGTGFVGFRLKGTRTSYYLPVDWCYREAVRAELARRKVERRRQRKEN